MITSDFLQSSITNLLHAYSFYVTITIHGVYSKVSELRPHFVLFKIDFHGRLTFLLSIKCTQYTALGLGKCDLNSEFAVSLV